MDMANLSNTQQANMFNAQQRIQSLFTDQASENASRQFNATSQNQVDQFFSQLGQQANQFNATQVNAQNLLGISNQAYNNLWQYYGDTMEWAWTSAENERSRVIELAKSQLAADSAADIQNLKNDYNSSTGFGKLIGTFLTAGKSSVAGSLMGGLF